MEGWTEVEAARFIEDRDKGFELLLGWLAHRAVDLGELDLRTDVRVDQYHVRSGGHQYRFWVRDEAIRPEADD